MSRPGDHLRLLAFLLEAPAAETLPILEEMSATRPWLGDSVAELRRVRLADWQAEHERLFVSGPCAPFESVRLGGLRGAVAVERLASIYRSIGLDTEGLAADHLGSMLECAAHLAAGVGPAAAEWRLWRDHLQRWLPQYGAELERESRLALYRLLGRELAVTAWNREQRCA